MALVSSPVPTQLVPVPQKILNPSHATIQGVLQSSVALVTSSVIRRSMATVNSLARLSTVTKREARGFIASTSSRITNGRNTECDGFGNGDRGKKRWRDEREKNCEVGSGSRGASYSAEKIGIGIEWYGGLYGMGVLRANGD